jgi:peptidoglycan/xylan/chitin deacetylase (PgdA/CDA1 family)
MSPTLLDLRFVRQYLRQKLLVSVPTSERRVALTFDDGPSPRNTPVLLDLLEQKSIAGTFFLVGKRVQQYGALTRRIYDAGHDIGNHGYHHLPMSLLPDRVIRWEILGTERKIVESTGAKPRYFRPPYGWFSDRLLEAVELLGYQSVIGSIHPRDSRQPGTSRILGRIRKRMEPGSIIILHDGGWRELASRDQTIDAVDQLTDELGAEGYRFDTLSSLLDSTADRDATQPFDL